MLLHSKLQAPRLPPRLLVRDSLQKKLAEILVKNITLVSAPPGFGKTTTTLQLLQSAQMPYVWYSLDSQDNDSSVFWRYLCTGFGNLFPRLGDRSLSILSVDKDPFHAVRSLLDELSNLGRSWRRPEHLILVLDDLHCIVDSGILEQLNYFLDHCPHFLHVLLVSRSVPDLHIPRRMVTGNCIKIDADQLRLSHRESREFLQGRTNRILSPSDYLRLHDVAEGWVGALQLLGINLEKCTVDQLVSVKAGADSVSEYLAQECYDTLEEWLQLCLLNLSIVPRFNTELTGVLCPDMDPARLIETLKQRHLFLTEMDEDDTWYRFHDLLRDWLNRQNRRRDQKETFELTKRAAIWLMTMGWHREAMNLWIHLGDWGQAAIIASDAMSQLLKKGEYLLMKSCLNLIPETELQRYPKLAIMRLFIYFTDSDWGSLRRESGRIKSLCQKIAQELETNPDQPETRLKYGMSPMDTTEELLAVLALIRSFEARMNNNVTAAVELIQSAESLNSNTLPYYIWIQQGKGADAFLLGDFKTAEQCLQETIRHSKQSGEGYALLTTLQWYIPLLLAQGKISYALQFLEEQKKWLEGRYLDCLPNWGSIYYLEFILLLNLNRLEDAERALTMLNHTDTTKGSAFDLVYYKWSFIALALEKRELGKSLVLMDELEGFVHQHFHSWCFAVPELSVFRALVHSLKGNPIPLIQWTCNFEPNETPGDINRYHIEYIIFLEVKTLIGEDWREQINELINISKNKGYNLTLINALIVMYLSEAKFSNSDKALPYLKEAIDIASPLQIELPFVRRAELLSTGLRRLENHPVYQVFAGRLNQYLTPSTPVENESRRDVVETLSEREISILKELSLGGSNEEIGGTLGIAASTVKTHLRNIYGKLGVKRRTQAIMKARDLGWL